MHQIGAIRGRLPAPSDCTAQDATGFDRVLEAEVKRALKRSEGTLSIKGAIWAIFIVESGLCERFS